MDKKNKRILYELDCNARLSNAQIAKRVGLSKEVVNYRIKNLEENVILQYQVIVNLAKLGIFQFKLCLKLQHITTEKLESIISQLKIYEPAKWIVTCRGVWDMIISLETHDFHDIDDITNEVLNIFGDHVHTKSLSLLTDAKAVPRSYLINESLEIPIIITDQTKKVELDELDKRILKELSQNARVSATELAKRLDSTVRIIIYRIKQMEKKQIILGYKIAINISKIGREFYKCFFYLDNPKLERVKSLQSYLKTIPQLTHLVSVIGNWDLEPEFEVESEKELNMILSNIKNNFADIIRTTDIISIEKEHKFVYF